MFVCTFIYMYIWVYTGEVNAKRIRERYLQAVLRQDIAYFDNVGAGEVATRIQTDTREFYAGKLHVPDSPPGVRSGTTRYLGESGSRHELPSRICHWFRLGIYPLLETGTGALFYLAVYRDHWRCHEQDDFWLHAVRSHFVHIPIAALTCSIDRASLKHVADGGTLAEEVISTVRTAQAFGTQRTLADLYDGHITQAYTADMRSAIWNGGSLAVFFFIIYAAYALGKWMSEIMLPSQLTPRL